MSNASPLLEIEDASIFFQVGNQGFSRNSNLIKAVDRVSLKLYKGEAVGLVGESGCGKTTLARGVLKLVDLTGGSISFNGRDISNLKGSNLKNYRSKVAAVFQDPFSSLNPRMTSGKTISEVLQVHNYTGNINGRAIELLELCGLQARFFNLYPHQMSGGQRQRVCIARALAIEPDLIVCDEAVSALDVSIQAQIINLLAELQRKLNLTYLFIGHDLSVVRHLCDRVAVMYLGKIVEQAPSEELFSNPLHPYTRALIDAVPNPDPQKEIHRTIKPLKGEPPSAMNPPTGCVFHPRCSIKLPKCTTEVPQVSDVPSDHLAACFAVNTIETRN
jgi:oligopeptide/dipeptide ABC transporter ATP-binding protein